MNEFYGFIAEILTSDDKSKMELLGKLKKSPDGDEFKDFGESKAILSEAYRSHYQIVKDEGYKTAERKVNEKWEKGITSSYDGFSTDKKGVELIGELVNFAKSSAKPVEKVVEKVVEFKTEDEVFANPFVSNVFQKKLGNVLGKVEKERDEAVDKLNEFHTKNHNQEVKQRLAGIASDHNYALGDKPQQQATRVDSLFYHTMAKIKEVKKGSNGKFIPIGHDDQQIKDPDLLRPMSLEEYVTKVVNKDGAVIPILSQNPDTGSPNLDQAPTSGGGKTTSIKSVEDYLERIGATTDPAVQKQLAAEFEIFEQEQAAKG